VQRIKEESRVEGRRMTVADGSLARLLGISVQFND